MKLNRPFLAVAGSLVSALACSGVTVDPDTGGIGGNVAAGGSTSGGAVASGGSSAGGRASGGAATSGGATGNGGGTSGGATASGGDAADGGGGTEDGGGPSAGGGENAGGAPAAGGGAAGGAPGAGGGGSGSAEGPCDIYNEAGNECVAAYSTIRRLLSTYTGPLYQVRSGSNAMNTGTGGMLHDIPQTADGFGDKAAQDAVCMNTTCTVAKLYDQSGRGNHITVAKAGLTNGGQYAGMDDFESSATKGPMKVAGKDVYSLYMEARQGYRQTMAGNGMALGDDPQGIYMLADGTRTGTACCWDFGNVTPNPKSYAEMNTLFLGVAYWGRGAGNGPWFGADFEAGVWMGGSMPGQPGWGGLNDAANAPPNSQNPSMRVKYALGFLKTTNGPERYALRMADIATATSVTTAYAGNYPSTKHLDSKGAVVLGVGGDNSNNSFSTFYEGAIVQGFPSDATENAVFENLKALGYGR
jgi:non-reducing end alpha-L-arabinofuranosidase